MGHTSTAFTGATNAKPGKLEQADRGTLFLDEIGELSQGAQAKLLRFLETHQTERLGSNRTIHLDVRVLAATNQDLDARSRQGTFRQDLYYRIHVVMLDLPPLRDRPDDIPLLVAHFLEQAPGARRPDISQAALDVLLAHDWPGNVRELRNALSHAVLLCRGDAILPEHLPRLLGRGQVGPGDDFRRAAAALLAKEMARDEGRGTRGEGKGAERTSEVSKTSEVSPLLYERLVAEFDRAILAEALKLTGRNQARTAALLGLHRTTLRNKIHDLGLGAKE